MAELEYYAWLIPVFPLLAFMLIILAPGLKDNKALSSWTAIIGVMAAWFLSWAIFFLRGEHLIDLQHEGEIFHVATRWMPTGLGAFDISFVLDGLSLGMIFMVPFVVTLIFVYSMGYHNLGTKAVEPRYSRFFAYVSLFAAGMLTLAISGNLLVFFIAWEIMGLCSYLLIGFWYEKGDQGFDFRKFADGSWREDRTKRVRKNPRWSSIKAFLTTRVGDVLFFAGLMWLYSASVIPSLNIYEVFTTANIEHLNSLPNWGIAGLFSLPVLPTIALLIFGGAVGKSAQFPLHVWLPDAMAGPTPVSAMIHAATMVAAGVFLVARILPLFEPLEGTPALYAVALIGAFTALFAATIALFRQDVKGVPAYSTISQLGFMIAALGIGGLVPAVFHMLTHAFFKALIFMASGSVIHGMEHGIHHVQEHAHHGHGDKHNHDDEHHHAHADHIDPENMWNMGGLRKHMPITFWTFLIGGASLAGVPFITAGFWSKDEILAEAAYKWSHHEYMGGLIPLIVLVVLVITALLTAFYTGRQLGLVFFGKERTEEAKHAHESPPSMWIPLVVLSIFAIGAGFVNIPAGVIPGWEGFHGLGHLLEEVHRAAGLTYEGHAFNWPLALFTGFGGLGMMVLGILLYRNAPQERFLFLGPIYTFIFNKWYIDNLYDNAIRKPAVATGNFLSRVDGDWLIDPIVNGAAAVGRRFGAVTNWADRYIVDGIVNLVAVVMDEVSNYLRLLQTGRVQNYLVILLAGLLVLAGIYFR